VLNKIKKKPSSEKKYWGRMLNRARNINLFIELVYYIVFLVFALMSHRNDTENGNRKFPLSN
jgi:hypothetical protein